jgi:hypothetical protein
MLQKDEGSKRKFKAPNMGSWKFPKSRGANASEYRLPMATSWRMGMERNRLRGRKSK